MSPAGVASLENARRNSGSHDELAMLGRALLTPMSLTASDGDSPAGEADLSLSLQPLSDCTVRPPRQRSTTGIGSKMRSCFDVEVNMPTAIWLSSRPKEERVHVRSVNQIFSEELSGNQIIVAIDQSELEAEDLQAQKRYIAAAEGLERSIYLRQKLLGDSHKELHAALERYVVLCNFWGIRCLASGQVHVSLELFKKAEAMTQASNVPDFNRRCHLRAATFNNLCDYFHNRGKLDAALHYAERSLGLEQKLTDNVMDAECLAQVRLKIAVLLGLLGRSQEAVVQIDAASAILQEQVQQGNKQEMLYSLAVAHYNRWVEMMKMGNRKAPDFLMQANLLARGKLGSSHPLTLKTDHALLIWGPKPRTSQAESCLLASSSSRPSPRLCLCDSISWKQADLSWEDAMRTLADEHAITLRHRTRQELMSTVPQRPSGRPPPRRSLKDFKFIESIYGALPRPMSIGSGSRETRPRLELAAPEARRGSALLEQQAYGVRPMSDCSARDSRGSCTSCSPAEYSSLLGPLPVPTGALGLGSDGLADGFHSSCEHRAFTSLPQLGQVAK